MDFLPLSSIIFSGAVDSLDALKSTSNEDEALRETWKLYVFFAIHF